MTTSPHTTIASLNSTWNQTFNRGDAAALARLYAENATLSPGNGQTLLGRAEIEKLFQSFVDGGVHQHTIDIVSTGGDEQVMFQVAKWNAHGAAQDGNTPSFGGILMSAFEKGADGQWLVRSHVWNMAG
ncbi:MAG TPA: SgcJ/EcaC family oxidoreductase [Methylophilaceae bacterium]|nr:SgcJ/EcaC family oxidoreductase [Methylophilaceae bacterium]HQR60854.1 SgcJ/EcaC family oxidoreductase [Methylophilaceae bacterium]